MKKITLTCILFTLLASYSILAQGSKEDYARADSLSSLFRNKVYYDRVVPSWIGKTNKFVYGNNTPDGTEYILIDPISKERSVAFSNEKLARAMMKLSEREINSKRLPIRQVNFAEDLKSFTFLWNNVEWSCKLPSYKLESGERQRERYRGDRGWR